MGDSERALSRSKSKSESYAKAKNAKMQLLRLKRQQRLQRQDSIGAIEELIQCGICLEKLTEPKMLPCQHTFCYSCLESHLMAHRILLKQKSLEDQISPQKRPAAIKCPVCQKRVSLEKGVESLQSLPKNLYVDSVLKLMEGNVSPPCAKSDSRCVKCQIYSETEGQCCQHCMQVFCAVCWSQHLSELESNLSVLAAQLEESKLKLDHKLESFESGCEHLAERVRKATAQRMELVKMDEEKVLGDVEAIVREGRLSYEGISAKIAEMRGRLTDGSFRSSPGKVFDFMSLHRETSRLLSQVGRFGEARVIFDADAFRLDQDTEAVYADGEEAEAAARPEKFEAASQFYRTRSYVPSLVWNRCPRPAHVGIPPWDQRLLYIAATDTRAVLILDRTRRKLEGRLTAPDMLYPQGLAFSKARREVYVSDKWKHCVHVFAKSGEYLRQLLTKGGGPGAVRSPDGLAMGPGEELVVCDSGNDRVLVVDPRTGDHLSTIGVVSKKTTLNTPTGVAVAGDRVVVADTGNHRVKVFHMDGRKLQEFGALGRGRGQFRSAEVVAVDPSGFILVGDGGNARVQVFRPDGTVVKIFGGASPGDDGFGWVSGILVTPEMEIITTDSKKRCLRIF